MFVFLQESFERESLVLDKDEEETQIEFESIEMKCGGGDILEDKFTTLQQPAIEGAVHTGERTLTDEVSTNDPISQDSSCQTLNSEIEKHLQTDSGSQNVRGKKTMEYEIPNLKCLVEKLEIVTNKLTDLDDSYDHFGRYISLLLKGLPPKKVLYLKQKIVSDVLQSVLAHEKGIPEESFTSCNSEFEIEQSKKKTLPKKKFFNGLSKFSFNDGTSNTQPYEGVSNLSRNTTQKTNTSASMYIDTENNRHFPLPCSHGNLMPNDRLQASSVKVISKDQSPFLIQQSVNNTESAENVSYSSLTYFPEVSDDVTLCPRDTISSDRQRKCIQHTTSESTGETTTMQYG